jgi:hypothetical protein
MENSTTVSGMALLLESSLRLNLALHPTWVVKSEP